MLTSSRYNIFIPLFDSCQGASFLLFNTLSGSIDLVDDVIHDTLLSLNSEDKVLCKEFGDNNDKNLADEVIDYLDRRGYLFMNEDEEMEHFDLLYKTFLTFHRQNYPQSVVVIPTYHCNLQCKYCWQRLHNMDSGVITDEVINRLFSSLPEIIENMDEKKIELVVFGGEPLMDYQDLTKKVTSILKKSKEHGFATKIITNGTGLADFIDDNYQLIDLIQVTIDGPPEIHNRRRPLPGADSFDLILKGLDRALKCKKFINLRVNVDFENLPSLPILANILEEHGWLGNGLLDVHLAPTKNHGKNETPGNQGNILQSVLKLRDENELMKIYNLDGFSGYKYIEGFKETGLLPLHRFFHCEAQTNFWAFDLRGDVYACWDAAGIPDLSVGKFSPEVMMDKEKLSIWRDHSSLESEKCKKCKIAPNCGGGCLFMAIEKSNDFLSNYCDPLLADYHQAITTNLDWFKEHAELGDHAVGLVVSDRVISEINLEYGLLDR